MKLPVEPLMRRVELWWRAAAVVLAVGSVLVGAPPAVRSALALLAVVAVAERLARVRGRGVVDTVLVATGGTLVTLVLLGLLLDLTGAGLHRSSWAVGLGVVALLGLLAVALAGRRRAPDAASTASTGPDGGGVGARLRAGLLALPWAAGVLAVTVIAVAMSVRATDRADVAPAQLSIGQVKGTSVQVVVSAGTRIGPLELRTQSANGTSLSYPLFSVPGGRTVRTTVTLPAKGRYTISLNYPTSSEPLRSLTLDR